jgi:outer membrane protein
MQIRTLILSALLTLLITTASSAQDLKFGHVNVADIVLLMPEYKNISTVMEAETKKLEAQLASMREELQKIEVDYENSYETYTPEQRTAKEGEYAAMQQRVQEFYSGAQQSLQTKQQELQVPVLDKLRNAIEMVGEEKGYLYIFEINSGLTLFQSEKSEDITPFVKAKLGL